MRRDRDYWDKVWSRPYGRYNVHHAAVFALLKPYLGGKVCDLGCGPCLIYKDKQVELTGVDFSGEALVQARRVVLTATLIQADVRHTGLPPGIFDTVVMLGLLDCFEDWREVLEEARRIKKPEGKIFATLLNGYKGHDWTTYPHITSNWYLYAEPE